MYVRHAGIVAVKLTRRTQYANSGRVLFFFSRSIKSTITNEKLSALEQNRRKYF